MANVLIVMYQNGAKIRATSAVMTVIQALGVESSAT